MKRLKVTDSDLARNGTVQRKPVKATLWARHEVDQTAGLVGKRRATRTTGSRRQYGLANSFDCFDTSDFLFGCGTLDEGQGNHAAIRDSIGDRVVGWLPISEAVAYRIAAARRGVVLEVLYDV